MPRRVTMPLNDWANLGEIDTLAAIRDALLPKLLSGSLPVPFAAGEESIP